MDPVLYETRPPAAVVTLNRPEKRNALSRDLISGLTEAFARAAEDAAARCVILTGAGPSFCAGMDLDELRGTLDADVNAEVIWHDASRLSGLFEQIYSLPKPTVAAVNGPAVAGGAGLVTVCDLAVASEHAKFGYPEVRRGLVAAMVLPHLLRHVGERAARHLLLTGELIDAREAARIGLINASLPEEDLQAGADRLARSLAEAGPEALAATKALLRECSGQAVPAEKLADASYTPRLGRECREGLEAFFAKRPALWARGVG